MACKGHELVVLLSTRGPVYDSQTVVRWCRLCGAVVVDVDVDGRVHPGDHTPMQFPSMKPGE